MFYNVVYDIALPSGEYWNCWKHFNYEIILR